MSFKLLKDFEPATVHDVMEWVKFGMDGEPTIIHIEDWTAYEWLREDNRKNSIYVLDTENRAVNVTAKGFQNQLIDFWGKPSSLVVKRWIDVSVKDGKRIWTTSTYHVNQLNPDELFVYESLKTIQEEDMVQEKPKVSTVSKASNKKPATKAKK